MAIKPLILVIIGIKTALSRVCIPKEVNPHGENACFSAKDTFNDVVAFQCLQFALPTYIMRIISIKWKEC